MKYVDTEGNLLTLDDYVGNPILLSRFQGSNYNTEQKTIADYTFKEVQVNP
ncbi:MucBP domain-containing protein [Vagococcus entomophilus]|uniref:MucBP domain-containing protein n=1 Tax=Vagococcus entomophilus TaxID=1160095 RepID=UPI002483016F|nr:MucBP domain-containing protein [Vagococcus entomophilus]